MCIRDSHIIVCYYAISAERKSDMIKVPTENGEITISDAVFTTITGAAEPTRNPVSYTHLCSTMPLTRWSGA